MWNHTESVLEHATSIEQHWCKCNHTLNLLLNLAEHGTWWIVHLIEQVVLTKSKYWNQTRKKTKVKIVG